jgi:hypothetical protein
LCGDPKKNLYDELAGLLGKHGEKFKLEEAQSLYAYLGNYCARQIRNSDPKYYRKTFELYEDRLKKNLLFQNGFLPKQEYKNIVVVGCLLKEFKWTLNFINEYQDFLKKEDREMAYDYNLGYYYLKSKNHDEAWETLVGKEFKDIFYNLGCRSILLQLCFERYNTAFYQNRFTNQAESFKSYLQRKKMEIGKSQYSRHSNFIRFAKRLFKLNIDMPFIKKTTFTKRIAETETAIEQAKVKRKEIAYDSWLHAQITKLKFKAPQ